MQSDTNNNHSSPFSLRRLVALITAVGMCTCECKFAVTSGRTTVDRKSPFVNHNPENCFHYSAVYFGEVDQGDERNQERIHPGISFLPSFLSFSLSPFCLWQQQRSPYAWPFIAIAETKLFAINWNTSILTTSLISFRIHVVVEFYSPQKLNNNKCHEEFLSPN